MIVGHLCRDQEAEKPNRIDWHSMRFDLMDALR